MMIAEPDRASGLHSQIAVLLKQQRAIQMNGCIVTFTDTAALSGYNGLRRVVTAKCSAPVGRSRRAVRGNSLSSLPKQRRTIETRGFHKIAKETLLYGIHNSSDHWIIATLTTGAIGGVTDTAGKAISDGYSGLKALIQKEIRQ